MSKTSPRVYVDTVLSLDATINLDGSQAHYLRDVMRLREGDAVRLFNGRDGEWQTRISATTRRAVDLEPVERTRPQTPEPGPRLIFAPVKKTGTSLIVEKATELGAARLSPMFTTYTDKSRLKIERLQSIAVEAAEQCGRLTIPTIDDPCSLTDLLAGLQAETMTAPSSAGPIFLADETGAGAPALDAMQGITETSQTAPAFVIGPQGGFSKSELAAFRQLSNVVAVDLGPRILRAETAAVSVLTCWQASRGDWRELNP